MPSPPELYVGLMSGTSLDGVDAVLVDLSGPPRLLGHAHHAFATELRDALMMLTTPGWDDLDRAAVAAQHLARAYASAVQDVLLHVGVDAVQVRAIGAHGQTVRHCPEAGYTLQLNAPATLAELTDIDVVADFRSRDVAAGGQGAPLLPAFHAAVFGAAQSRAIVNIGGIANITVLGAVDGDVRGDGQRVADGMVDGTVDGTANGKQGTSAARVITGFDTGPGNVLLDLWVAEHQGVPFDRDGAWAAGGAVDPALLEALLEEPFFTQPAPRSTGRERFNRGWLASRLTPGRTQPQDVQATLTRLSAVTIARSVAQAAAHATEVVVCGGGARNRTLMQMLASEVAPRRVIPSDALGIAAEHVEAMGFAWLARACVRGAAGNLPAVTGARGPRVLGAVYAGAAPSVKD
jgi:anhydro-N-acetylmuramic acid kinase